MSQAPVVPASVSPAPVDEDEDDDDDDDDPEDAGTGARQMKLQDVQPSDLVVDLDGVLDRLVILRLTCTHPD